MEFFRIHQIPLAKTITFAHMEKGINTLAVSGLFSIPQFNFATGPLIINVEAVKQQQPKEHHKQQHFQQQQVVQRQQRVQQQCPRQPQLLLEPVETRKLFVIIQIGLIIEKV